MFDGDVTLVGVFVRQRNQSADGNECEKCEFCFHVV